MRIRAFLLIEAVFLGAPQVFAVHAASQDFLRSLEKTRRRFRTAGPSN